MAQSEEEAHSNRPPSPGGEPEEGFDSPGSAAPSVSDGAGPPSDVVDRSDVVCIDSMSEPRLRENLTLRLLMS